MTSETYMRELLKLAQDYHELTTGVWVSPERREEVVTALLSFIEKNAPAVRHGGKVST